MHAFICRAWGSRAGRRCDEKGDEGEDMELTSQWTMILVSGLLLLLGLVLVAWMYNQNRKEGIDPNAIFTQIPPA